MRTLALLTLSVPFIPAALYSQDDALTWQNTYADALRVARETHKPILVEFRCEP